MKCKFETIIVGWFALLILAASAYAQAPSSVAGDGFLAGVSSGSYPLASYGYYLFIPANSGNSYQVVGIYNVYNSSGTYSYSQESPSRGTLNVNDSLGGAGVLIASFVSASSGSFYETAVSYPGAYQSGSFGFSSVNAPGALGGRTVNCSIIGGASPFYSSGSYTMTLANSGNTYTISTGQSGTYSYYTLNRSTGVLQLNDSVTGSTMVYFGFSSATGGGFAIKNATGYQVGNFVLSDTTMPSLTITSPVIGQRLTNSVWAVTGQASDNVQVSAVYYQVLGQSWTLATTANSWATWSGNIILTVPGTNYIQAYAVDSSGNQSVIHSQMIDYVVTGRASVSITGRGTVSPNYDGQQLEVGHNYTMTASAAPGFLFGKWTGDLQTTSATATFMMQSSINLTANFVDVTQPSCGISIPSGNQFVSNVVFSAKGVAMDNDQVTNVFCQINNAGWVTANTTNSWTNWTAPFTLTQSNNLLKAYAADKFGNLSPTSSVAFTYIASDTLRVRITGQGLVNPNYSNVLAQLGAKYSVTASAAPGFIFTNWVKSTNWIGGVISNSATISFVMQSNLTLQANFLDIVKPTLNVLAPLNGQRSSNAVYNIIGTASDTAHVANVLYRINDLPWSSATSGNGWSNWSAQATLIPGTNKLSVYAVDTSGNCSLTNMVSWQFVVTNLLTVQARGLGSVVPNYNNSWLETGRNYFMTATPAAGFSVTNWTISTNWLGGRITNSATVQFMMISNLTLQVNFADVSKPALNITAPLAGQRMTNALATFIGTASDNWKVAGVWYQLNSNMWNLVTATTNSYTNWSQTVPLVIGTNTFKAYALDLGGNFSTTNTWSVIASNTFMLRLSLTNASPITTNGMTFSLQLSAGLAGHIQVSTNLIDWAALTNFVGTNPSINFRDRAATNSTRRFYRAVIP